MPAARTGRERSSKTAVTNTAHTTGEFGTV
uniref:Uncharacterized protein n=1 Tax=Anguilla anguilla TaxID=7936 RepID=A0A0E9U4Y7_ANGAN